MKIHHLNCGTMCPHGASFLPGYFPKKLVTHCLLIEDRNKLILVDTGFGLQDIKQKEQLGFSRLALAPALRKSETAFQQIKKLGFSPADVTDIIPTHLDMDHAGGIQDFPKARVHVSKAELKVALERPGLVNRERYRSHQFPTRVNWVPFNPSKGEKWNGFNKVKAIAGLPPEILLVSLPGHTKGHTGVAVKTKTSWLLHAGDAYYSHKELQNKQPFQLGIKIFQKLVHDNYKEAMKTQAGLIQLQEKEPIEIFCSHDPIELKQLR